MKKANIQEQQLQGYFQLAIFLKTYCTYVSKNLTIYTYTIIWWDLIITRHNNSNTRPMHIFALAGIQTQMSNAPPPCYRGRQEKKEKYLILQRLWDSRSKSDRWKILVMLPLLVKHRLEYIVFEYVPFAYNFHGC